MNCGKADPGGNNLDPVGNRTVSHISGSHVTDAANRLTGITFPDATTAA